MHAIHCEVVVAGIFQYSDARLACCIGIHVIAGRILGMAQLESRAVDEVGNHEDAIFLEHSVSRSVSICGNSLYSTFQGVAGLE